MKDYIIVGFGFAGISIVHLLEKNNKGEVNGGSVYDGVKHAQTSVPVQTPQGK